MLQPMKRRPAQDPLEFFGRLGMTVEQKWRNRNYDPEAFPQIAEEALVEHSPLGRIDPWEIIRSLGGSHPLPSQQDVDGLFGNPPITLFMGSRFYVDIYFWLDGTTTIHQHGFAGAFQVLLGSSIHSHYTFVPRWIVNPHFAVGQLALKEVQLLELGDIRQIIPGSQYIHSLFHLARPSATITIRTIGLPAAQPQFNYLKPGIAYDPFFKEAAIIKKVQSVDLLLKMRHPGADSIIRAILSNSDFHTAFMILDIVYHNLRGDELEKFLNISHSANRFNKLLGFARRRHGKVVDLLPEVFREGRRQTDLIGKRSYVNDNDLRFFLALLLNVTGRKTILNLIKRRFPEQPPIETTLDWAEELSRTKVFGSTEPNALGIDGFGDHHLFVLECLLKNKSPEQTWAHVRKIYRSEDPGKLKSQTTTIYERLLKSPVLKPLFDDSAAAPKLTTPSAGRKRRRANPRPKAK